MKSFLILVSALLAASPALAAGEFGTGAAELLKFSGYSTFRWDKYGAENSDPDNNMRASASVNWLPRLNSFVSGKMNLDLYSNSSNSIRLADISLSLNITENFTLTAGQMKVPFGYAYTRSGGSMYFADRALISSAGDYKNYAGRDNGLCLVAGFAPVTVDLGFFNGTGSNGTADNDINKRFASRVSAGALDWLTLGAAFTTIGQPEIEDSLGTIDSWSSHGIDVFGVVDYPLSGTTDLFFEGEYAILGAEGPEVEGVTINDAGCMSLALGADISVGDGFLRAVRPVVRYDMVNPSSVEGSADKDNSTALDFCVGLDLTSGKNTLMLGGRSYGFEDESIEGYTDIYLNWRMNF